MAERSGRGRSLRGRTPKPVRVLIGLVVMALLVGGALWFVGGRAGQWGVPYFGFTTPGGSQCTNTWSGFACEQISAEDFTTWAHFALPIGTTLLRGHYTSTHDYRLHAVLRTESDPITVDLAWRSIAHRFGRCQDIGVPPLDLTGHSDICLMNSRLRPPQTEGVPRGESWTVATGIDPDGSRLTIIDIASL